MEKADLIVEQLKTLTHDQLNELIALFEAEKAKQAIASQERSKMCAR
mgnify:CR=1 FL=1